MQKPITRINLLAKRLKLTKSDIAMSIIYIMTHDKVMAWAETKGHASKAKSANNMAQLAFRKPMIKKFIEMLGGMLGINAALYFSQSGLPNDDCKELNTILTAVLVDPKSDTYRMDKINNVLNFALHNGLSVNNQFRSDQNKDGDNMSGASDLEYDNMTDDEKRELRKKNNTNRIELRPDMSKEEYLLYLIQEQGRSDTQKAKNDFTLKISEYMAFKSDKTNELRPTIYLCNREHTSTLERLSSLAKGSFNK